MKIKCATIVPILGDVFITTFYISLYGSPSWKNIRLFCYWVIPLEVHRKVFCYKISSCYQLYGLFNNWRQLAALQKLPRFEQSGKTADFYALFEECCQKLKEILLKDCLEGTVPWDFCQRVSDNLKLFHLSVEAIIC